MATGFATPSAIQVGSYFVQQYYQILQKQTDFVHQFYTDASTMLRVDGDAIESASSMLQIHSLVMSINFTTIEIKTAHSLDSWNGGVLVMVSGSVQTKDHSGRRKFIQTFFLAPQEKGYFVLNDIFHFLDEEQIHQHPAAILGSQFDDKLNISSPPPEPVSDYLNGEETQSKELVMNPTYAVSDYLNGEETQSKELVMNPTYAVSDYLHGEETQSREFVTSSHVEGNEPVDKFSLPEQEQQQLLPEADSIVEETPVEESTISLQHALHPVKDSSAVLAEEPAVEAPKQTYASILRVAKGQSSSSVPSQPSLNKSAPPTSQWHHSQQPTFNQSYPALSISSERSVGEAVEELTVPEEVEGKSVYVRNLPPSISCYEIEEEFRNFGRIKPEGVVVRNRKDINIWYAFVDFEDVVGVQNAIKASPIQFGGRQVHIEERRANGTSNFRGGRRGRGRGGYQPDSSRGRSGGRSFGRGSGQEVGGGDRDYNRPRGNGFYQRGARQDGGWQSSETA